MRISALARSAVIVLCIAGVFATTGCKTNREKKNPTPETLYKQARQQLDSYDYNRSIKTYEALTARFPFTDQARQARIDLIYAYYRQGETESALDAADTFIRENPTHPRVDYAWYIKGLVDFERTPNAFERLFRADLTKRPPVTARKSFEAFRTVVEQYPKSIYAHDAQRRMIYLRNRLANYDVHVAQYYMQRGAFVGAAQRATHVLENYDGAPAMKDALNILIEADQRLGLNERAEQAEQVYAANFASVAPAARPKPWWKLW